MFLLVQRFLRAMRKASGSPNDLPSVNSFDICAAAAVEFANDCERRLHARAAAASQLSQATQLRAARARSQHVQKSVKTRGALLKAIIKVARFLSSHSRTTMDCSPRTSKF